MQGDDITRNFHGGNRYSQAAHDTTPDEVRGKQRRAAYMFIFQAWPRGCTCDEYEAATNIKHQTASARFTELKRDGLLTETGFRPTRSNKMAAVYVTARQFTASQQLDLF
jgi:hypothetical protein